MRELHPVLVLVLVVYGRARQQDLEADLREEGQPNRQQVLEPVHQQPHGEDLLPRKRPSVSFATDERARLFWERAETDLVEQLAAASERVFDAKLTPEAVRQRLLPSVRQSRGGDWMLKAKLPAHARFWNAGGTFADRPAELAHCAARVRLRARSLWLMSGMCGLSLEVTDLRVEPPSRECPLLFLPMPQPFFRSVEKFRMATHVLERREQLRPVRKAAVDAEALKRGASREEVSRLHDELARGAPVLERRIADGLLAGSRRRRSTSRTGRRC